jgi:hypothetical protein
VPFGSQDPDQTKMVLNSVASILLSPGHYSRRSQLAEQIPEVRAFEHLWPCKWAARKILKNRIDRSNKKHRVAIKEAQAAKAAISAVGSSFDDAGDTGRPGRVRAVKTSTRSRGMYTR